MRVEPCSNSQVMSAFDRSAGSLMMRIIDFSSTFRDIFSVASLKRKTCVPTTGSMGEPNQPTVLRLDGKGCTASKSGKSSNSDRKVFTASFDEMPTSAWMVTCAQRLAKVSSERPDPACTVYLRDCLNSMT